MTWTGRAAVVALLEDVHFMPNWSPDGKRIAFIAVPNQLQVINADGSGLHTVIRSSGLFLLGRPDRRS